MTETDIASWDQPDGLAPRARVVLIPGRGEHPGIYARFGRRLSFDAYQVRVTADPTVAADAVAEQVAEALADTPEGALRVLAGSDSGAVFAASLVASGRQAVEGVLLAGLLATTGAEAAAATGASADWAGELDQRTDCPTHRNLLDADGKLRRGALADAVPAEWFAEAELGRIEVPLLGLHGEQDTVSPLAAVSPLYEKAPRAQLAVVRAGRHDILNGINHRSVAATVTLFLERLRLGPTLPDIVGQAL